MELTYKITFLSDWHSGSGLSGGAEADATVIKDDRNLPYIAGKTIKGLLKEALEEIHEVKLNAKDRTYINELLGYEIKDEKTQKVIETKSGIAFFSNATLSKDERDDIIPTLSDFLYRNIASTQIKANGTAKESSLRVMEVCIPITLEGKITRIASKEQIDLLTKALKWVRHLGVNRNRGLGRCKFVEITPKSN
ncbi:RAMP superfamily CRISPR-associated protein [Arcicella sp. DC2W]|uniref:RAMP superfamily CRISPR-associated protein n=1 Tax=Arcicella gelida TaxID=2984195 RepID=A0ABU5S345_9BACT|nr:RAMP superfamily CRISPR-associated protein [Arcicella sp. DC2W]MEA5402819.1 RAMP superfamily CRISPR-associated protein [Arcicella sp. DC2W]